MNDAPSTVPPIDFTRYPIDGRDDTARRDIVSKCRQDLSAYQYCSLPEFFNIDVMEKEAERAKTLLPLANPANSRRNCYLQRNGDPSLPDNHPRNIMNPARYRMIAADRLPAESALKQMYFWPLFQKFIAEIVDEPVLYPSEDLLQPVNVICYGEGDQSAWHYDSTNAFTMTLMLQEAEKGGSFELAANTRNGPEDEDLDYMLEVLGGNRDRVKTVSRSAGELTIFRGCNSLHRVSPVKGDRLRMMAVFVYESEPGIVGDPEVNMTVYGRTGREAIA